MITFHSTRSTTDSLTSKQAIRKGIADDGGLFVTDALGDTQIDVASLAGKSYQQIAQEVLGALLPGIASVLHAFWYFSGPLALLIIRKPGAAVYVNLVGAVAEMVFGNSFAFSFVFISAALQGVFAEIPFALARYRKYNLPLSIASGLCVALEYGFYLLFFRYQGVALLSPRGIVHLISEVVGGVVFAGVMSWFLYLAIARTGALDRFASGRAIRGLAD